MVHVPERFDALQRPYGFGSREHGVDRVLPNNAFKPNLLRSTKAMAEKACHGFGSTTQVGLTQALGLVKAFWGLGGLPQSSSSRAPGFLQSGGVSVPVLSFVPAAARGGAQLSWRQRACGQALAPVGVSTRQSQAARRRLGVRRVVFSRRQFWYRSA